MSARTRIPTIAALTALLVAVPSLLADDREPDARESYSYVRALDGRATLASQGSAPGEEASVNQPLLTGDRVSVERGARVELALADRSLVRVGGGSVLVLTRVAFSGDRGDRATLLDLEDGELVLTVTEDALGDSLPEIRTNAAEVVIHRPGTYRVATAPEGWTEVVVRAGFAEVVTGRGSSVVREGETAWASLSGRGVELAAAGNFSSLELWGEQLAAGARQAELHVEPELAYQAAPLAEYGSWVSVDSAWYWQPRVEVGWRPYWHGRWGWTPSGLTWISSEPWGWVPYHYGTWCQLPSYGWVWRPGYLYSPAWVYWHWSDAWVGWCPVGYYTNWYGGWGGYGYGFRHGIYGWAGGGWHHYHHWNFAPNHCLRRHDQRRWHRRGGDLERELGPNVPRGVITTDTRSLPRDRFADRGVARDELARRARRTGDGNLADVTDFVARRRDLSPDLRDVVRSEPGSRVRLADVPEPGDGRPRADGRGRVFPESGDAGRARSTGEGAARAGDGRVAPRPRSEDGSRSGDGRAPAGATDPDLNPGPRTADRRGDDTGDGDVRPRTAAGDRAGGDREQVTPRSRPPVPGDGGTAGDVRPRTPAGDRTGGDREQVTPRSRPPAGDRGESAPATTPSRTRPPAGDSPRRDESGRPAPAAGGLRPGGALEIDARGRVRPLGGAATPAGSADAARSPVSERQGWRSREGWTGTVRSLSERLAPGAGTSPQTLRGEPVQRVLGGIRSGAGAGSERSWQAPGDRPVPSYSRPSPATGGRPGAPGTVRPGTTRPGAPTSSGTPAVRTAPRGSDSSASPQRPSSSGPPARAGSSASPSGRSSSGGSRSSGASPRGSGSSSRSSGSSSRSSGSSSRGSGSSSRRSGG